MCCARANARMTVRAPLSRSAGRCEREGVPVALPMLENSMYLWMIGHATGGNVHHKAHQAGREGLVYTAHTSCLWCSLL